jgi:DNA primase
MDAVEDVKQRLGVEDVIGEYIELKRAGRNLKGLSPFSNEKTASFMVSPEKQIWHDFSSGKGGNMFSFVMEMEGVDFKSALEILARKAGVDLSKYRSGDYADRTKQKDRLYQCLETATKFYQLQFSKNKTALEYILKKRAYTKETALKFKIGYSPNTGDALTKYLRGKKFSDKEIIGAGLATDRYNKTSDMFRGRIMVPLCDGQGRVIGFTARLLADDDSGPKYINTAQTMLYDKGRNVFGLHLAKDQIRTDGFVVVAEGNLDVIASHQAGIANVVASAGTAMTEMHLKELARFTDDVRLAFDQDNAGLNAMERVIPLASKTNINLSIITIPDGKDPDELIKKDPKIWREVINSYDYALDWLINQYKAKNDPRSARGKKAITDAILPVINQLTDSVEQDHYLTRLAEIVQVDKSALNKKFTHTKKDLDKSIRYKKVEVEKVTSQQADNTKSQNQLLALCLKHTELRKLLEGLGVEMFSSEPARVFYARLLGSDKSAERLRENDDYGKILEVLYEELYSNLELVELQYEAARLQVHVIENYVKNQKHLLAQQMREADASDQNKLIERDQELNQMLKRTRG